MCVCDGRCVHARKAFTSNIHKTSFFFVVFFSPAPLGGRLLLYTLVSVCVFRLLINMVVCSSFLTYVCVGEKIEIIDACVSFVIYWAFFLTVWFSKYYLRIPLCILLPRESIHQNNPGCFFPKNVNFNIALVAYHIYNATCKFQTNIIQIYIIVMFFEHYFYGFNNSERSASRVQYFLFRHTHTHFWRLSNSKLYPLCYI